MNDPNLHLTAMKRSSGTLYLMPVPMSDAAPSEVLPPCNIALVGQIKHFIVENLRSARRFLKRCDPSVDIDAMTFSVLDVNTPREAVPQMLAPLAAGADMAVVSEAGCPAVADPGALAVEVAQRNGWRVVPLVGPSSILMALMASGFNGQSFAFHGYLPIDAHARVAELKRLERLAQRDDQTQIFIETPYRNGRLIDTAIRTLSPHTRLCVASDITGPRESIVTLTMEQWARRNHDIDKVPSIFLIYK